MSKRNRLIKTPCEILELENLLFSLVIRVHGIIESDVYEGRTRRKGNKRDRKRCITDFIHVYDIYYTSF